MFFSQHVFFFLQCVAYIFVGTHFYSFCLPSFFHNKNHPSAPKLTKPPPVTEIQPEWWTRSQHQRPARSARAAARGPGRTPRGERRGKGTATAPWHGRKESDQSWCFFVVFFCWDLLFKDLFVGNWKKNQGLVVCCSCWVFWETTSLLMMCLAIGSIRVAPKCGNWPNIELLWGKSWHPTLLLTSCCLLSSLKMTEKSWHPTKRRGQKADSLRIHDVVTRHGMVWLTLNPWSSLKPQERLGWSTCC